MTAHPSLDELLRSGEWNGAEFKAAKSALPKSAFETVSAFANTRGGWIVLGVTQSGERFEVSGVDEPDKVQNDFLSVLHAGQKISHDVDVTEHRYEHDGKVIPKPVLDVRFLGYASTEDFDETRWIDRLVSEVNIIETWQQLLAKYLFFMPKTFRDIDPATLERRDAPAGFRVFREAAMNLLIHQDYGDHSRKAVIEFFTDGIKFWNPGDSFADEKHLLDPGEKDVRNPAIAMAIRRIGMCEQAGTGLRMMQREWQALGHAPPVNVNDRVRKSFTTFLPEPRALATPEVAPVTPEVGRLVDVLEGEMSRGEIMAALGLRDEKHFRVRYQQAATGLRLIEMTLPDKPNSRLQRYRLTETGKALRALRGTT